MWIGIITVAHAASTPLAHALSRRLNFSTRPGKSSHSALISPSVSNLLHTYARLIHRARPWPRRLRDEAEAAFMTWRPFRSLRMHPPVRRSVLLSSFPFVFSCRSQPCCCFRALPSYSSLFSTTPPQFLSAQQAASPSVASSQAVPPPPPTAT